MSFSLEESRGGEDREEDNDILDDDPNEQYGIRDGTLFIIDSTPPMFETNPESGVPYFVECIKQYEEILKMKLSWSRQDWMGLVLFGTEKWDTEPETKNILTLHKLSQISTSNLKDVMKITNGKWKEFKDISSNSSYPLHDVLWHAAQMFYSIKTTMSSQRLIIFTCRDYPPMTDKDEEHRIRVKVSSFKGMGLQLFVVGLGDNWNHDRFYKDLEMLCENIDSEDYERTSLKDLISQVKLSARNMAKLPLNLGEGVTLDVSIRNLTVKTTYLKPCQMSSATNALLTTRTKLEVENKEKEDSADEDDRDNKSESLPILETDIQKYQEFGNRKIYFTPNEVLTLSAIQKRGINVICAKPISYHPLYHYNAPFFLTCDKSYRKDNQLLFGAILNKCDARNLMLICTAVIRERSAPALYTLIPRADHGGFFLYRVPFLDNVRNVNDYLQEFIYGDENQPPTIPEALNLFSKMIGKLRIEYDPDMFPNPKLQTQMKALEALALDLEKAEKPEDLTLPADEEIQAKIQSYMEEYKSMFEEDEEEQETSHSPVKKRRREPVNSTTLDENQIRELVEKDMLEGLTVAHLKNIMKTAGLKGTGNKQFLLQKIKEHYAP